MAASGSVFPAFLKLEYQDDGTAQTGFAQAVEAMAERGRQRIRRFSVDANQALSQIGAGNALERALSLPRTAIGSLDLGVTSLRHMAQQAGMTADAARELERGMERLQQETQQYTAASMRELTAMRALAAEKGDAAEAAWAQVRAVEALQSSLDKEAIAAGRATAASKVHAVANDNALTSVGAMRAGAQQLSYQIGDVAQGFALGTPPMTIFAQQGGQVVQALGLMRGSAGGLVGFLSGPWGAALMGAVTVTAALGSSFLSARDDSDEFSKALRDMTGEADRTADALKRLQALQKSTLEGDVMLNGVKLAGKRDRLSEIELRLAKPLRGTTANDRYQTENDLLGGNRREQLEVEARQLRMDIATLQGLIDAGNHEIARRSDAESARETARAKPSGISRADTLSDEARAAKQAAEEADRFIASLDSEIQRLTLSAGELRQLEVAKARDAAVTDVQRKRIDELNAAREEALSTADRLRAIEADTKARAAMEQRIQSIQNETQLLSLVGPARDKASLALEHEAFLAQAAADGLLDAETAWQRYHAARIQQIDTQSALDRDRESAELFTQEIERLIGGVSRLGSVGGALGGLLGLATGNLGSISGPLGALLSIPTGTAVGEDGKLIARRIGDELREVFGKGGEFPEAMTEALKGASIGVSAGALVSTSATSQLGSALGGALGQAAGESFTKGLTGILGSAGGPLGAIAGGLVGALVGGLFNSAQYGTASLTGANGAAISARGSGRASGASSLGGAVQQALANIADQLDAEVGSYLVSIGTYKDNYRVSTRGSSGKLGGYSGTAAQNEARYGLYDFGDDQGAAIAFAVLDAIKDGAIKGLRASTQRLLQAGSDAEQAIADALNFESVFSRLAVHKDPVGAALDELDDEFSSLKRLFTQASATQDEWLQLEELYWIERDELLTDALDQELGTLRSFLDELTTGNSALSLRDRKATAMASYAPLADRVAAGDATAYDDFVDAARTLLDIERQLSGSQSGYFDLLSEVTGLTQKALDGGTNYSDRDSPFGTRSGYNEGAGIVAGLDSLRDEIAAGTNGQLQAVNANLGTVIELLAQQNVRMPQYASINGGW